MRRFRLTWLRAHSPVVRGAAAECAAALEAALAAYLRRLNERLGEEGDLLRGPVGAHPATGSFELGRMIDYVHENPRKTATPIVEVAVHYPWSSQRAYDGLSLAPFANVGRAEAILGPHAARARTADRPDLEDLAPSRVPEATPDTLLAAAADTFGLAPWRLAGRERGPRLNAARALFLRLAALEGYSLARLAPVLDRSVAATYRFARPIDDRAVRIARTLVRTAGICGHLVRASSSPSEKEILT